MSAPYSNTRDVDAGTVHFRGGNKRDFLSVTLRHAPPSWAYDRPVSGQRRRASGPEPLEPPGVYPDFGDDILAGLYYRRIYGRPAFTADDDRRYRHFGWYDPLPPHGSDLFGLGPESYEKKER